MSESEEEKEPTDIVISVDPGKEACGMAMFVDGKLTECGLARFRRGGATFQRRGMSRAMVEQAESWARPYIASGAHVTLVIERMVTRKEKPGAHNDLITLSLIAGGLWAWDGWDRGVDARPGVWSGKRPKEVNHARARRTLDDNEILALEAGLKTGPRWNQKETLDAVSIGLWHLKRL